MARLETLKAATSLSDLARLLSLKPSTLSYILYIQPKATKYTAFLVPKRNGGQRTINAPDNALKLVQRRLSDLLQDCVAEINTNTGRKDRVAHGFKRRRSIITNAHRHRHRRYVFNIDLEDFFPSINFGRVRGILMKNRDFALHERVATVIAQIACHDNSLPQGSPCSPVISNLVAQVLDMRLVKLATATGCTYSRYADDLTFSTNQRQFPPEIAIALDADGPGQHCWQPGTQLEHAITRNGFRINSTKTRMMYRNSRQEVTGLVVNKKINVRAEYRHDVRAMVHRLMKTGTFDIYRAANNAGVLSVTKQPGSLDELHGMLGFIDTLDVHNRSHDSKNFSATERVYRNFLLYRNFYAAEKPVIICEGKTDNIYLTHAIRSLASEFPSLAEITNGKIHLKIRLFKYARSSTARILGLNDGGSSVLANFIARYRNETRHFAAPGQMHAVVILYDNDSGAKDITNAIKQTTKGTPTNADPFVHITKNLYALPVPIVGNAQTSVIEDCFDTQTKAITVDGKTFNAGSKIDTDKEYGKIVFADRA